MQAEATSEQPPAETASASLGRSLGRAARLATVWLGAVSGSIDSLVSRTRPVKPGPANASAAAPLLEELAALLRAQPEGEFAALAENARFWALIERLHTARHLGVPAPEAAPAAQTPEVVEAEVVEAAVEPAPTKGRGARAKAAVAPAEPAPEAPAAQAPVPEAPAADVAAEDAASEEPDEPASQ